MELPYFKFYSRDWSGDEQLGMCSLGARGLWIGMLAIMASNTARRGFLEVGGVPIKDADVLARQVRADTKQVDEFLSELDRMKVFSRDANGVIFSRRMVREAAVSEVKRQAGLQGGNPSLVKHPIKRAAKQVVKHPVKLVDKPRDHKPENREQRTKTISLEPLELLTAQGSGLSQKDFLEGHEPESEAEFIELMLALCGREEGEQWNGRWRKDWRANSVKVIKALRDLRSAMKEGAPIGSVGGYLRDVFDKRMAT